MLAWAIGGVIALIGALCYAELGARRPNAGGGYVYLREAFGLIIAFVYGWNLLVVNHSGAIAAVATVFVDYAATAVGVKLADPRPLADRHDRVPHRHQLVRHPRRIADAKHPHRFETARDLRTDRRRLESCTARPPAPPAPPINAFSMFGALMPVLFSYGGWYYVNDIAGELRDPRRNLPRALIFGMLLVAACYLLANLSYLLVLGHAGLAASETPAADVMQHVFGDTGGAR